MRNTKLKNPLMLRSAALALLVAVAGCEKTREVFGLSRQQVNEFETIDRKPLEVPPSYDLRPPRPGQKSVLEKDGSTMARQALGETPQGAQPSAASTAAKLDAASATETELLVRAQGATKDQDIRQKLETEKEEPVEQAPGLKLLSKKTPKKRIGKVINPHEEQARIEREKLEKRELEQEMTSQIPSHTGPLGDNLQP